MHVTEACAWLHCAEMKTRSGQFSGAQYASLTVAVVLLLQTLRPDRTKEQLATHNSHEPSAPLAQRHTLSTHLSMMWRYLGRHFMHA